MTTLLVTLTLLGKPGEADSLWTMERLSGDWGGARSSLEERGLSLEFYYTADIMANVAGGIRRRAEVLGNVDLLLTAELEPLVGWPGATAFLYGLGNHGGDPTDSVGDIQVVNNIEAFDTWKLYEAWLEQAFLDERVTLRGGLYDLNSEFDVIPAASVFINSAHGIGSDFGNSGKNGPSIFPTTSPGVRLELRPAPVWYARAVVLDGVPGDPEEPRGTEVILRRDDGLLLAAEIGFFNLPELELEHRTRQFQDAPAAPPGEPGGYYGKYALGVWGYTAEFEDLSRRRGDGSAVSHRGTGGVYLLGEQRVYCEPDDPHEGLAVFARAGLADRRVNPIDAYLGAGLVYHGPIPGRGEDRVGFAVAAAHLSERFREAARRDGDRIEPWEIALELTYDASLAPWLAFQPDLQVVLQPAGGSDLRDAVVLGARVVISF